MKLHLGKMTGKEISEWLGISYTTYRQKPAKQQQKLIDFCEFEPVRGGVNITQIYIYTYNPHYQLERDRAYYKAVHETSNMLASVSNIAKLTNSSEWTMRKARNFLYGEVPTNIDQNAKGYIGSRRLVWAVKLDGINNYRYLTSEEKALFNNLCQQFSEDQDPQVVQDRELILDYCVRNGLSAEAYRDIMKDKGYDFYTGVLVKFKYLTGLTVVSTTLHKDGELCAWDEDGKYLIKLEEEEK